MHVAPGLVVTLEFALRSDEGELLDWTEPGAPLAYLHGTGRLLPGLERALEGRAPGERLAVEIPPDDAYGWPSEEMVEAVPRAQLAGHAPLEVGACFEARTPSGRVRFATVLGIEGDVVLLDMNHPLAGRTLHADVHILSVRPPTAAESAGGRVLAGLDPDVGSGSGEPRS